jgi:alkyl hydroperoxide reductase subunit AhpF
MPAGFELTTLVHGIFEASRAAPALSGQTLERLAALEDDVAIDVYVTPT